MANKSMVNRKIPKERFTMEIPKSLKVRLESAKRRLSADRNEDLSVGRLLCEFADENLKKFGL